MKLNRTGSNWNELERNKINENWDIIEGNYNDVVDKVSEEAFDKVVNSAKLNWKEPVDSFADLPKSAEEGDTRMVRDSGKVYRFNGEVWQEIQQIDAGPVNELDARLTSQLAETNSALSGKVTMLKENKLLTVGIDGDFNNLNDAIKYLTNYYPMYVKNGLNVEIKLLSGFEMKEQVSVSGIDLGWITISSEDEEVIISRQSLLRDIDSPSVTKSAFLGYSNATLPTINTVFKMDSTGDITHTRVFSVRGNSKMTVLPSAGATGDAERLLVVSHGSSVYARLSKFYNCINGMGVRVSNSGIFQAEYADISGNEVNLAVATGMANVDSSDLTNARYDGLRSTTGPNIISASNVDVSNCGRYGVHVLRDGNINFYKGKANNCGTNGIFIDGGGFVNAEQSNVNGCVGSNIKVIAGSLNFENGTANDAGLHGIEVLRGGNVSARLSSVKNATNIGCLVSGVSSLDFHAGDATGYGQYGIAAYSLSRINAVQAKARKTEENDSTSDIVISSGGSITAIDSIGGVSDNPNNLTSKGFIIK